MRILTKFIWSSVALVGLTLSLSVGSEFLLKEVDRSTETTHQKANRASTIALELKILLRDQIAFLRNYLVLGRESSDMAGYYKVMSEFKLDLGELESLMVDKSELTLVRRRHQLLLRLVEELRDTPGSKERTIQDFRAINSFRQDIDFSLDSLVDSVEKQNQLAQQHTRQLKQQVQTVRYTMVGLILLMFVGQFILILQPVIQSIRQLQFGVNKISTGDLEYRLNIQTQDEIERLAQSFNEMAGRLAEFYRCLEQKVSDRTAELTKMNRSLEKEITDRKRAEVELQKALQNLQQTQTQLIQTEKMSSLGQLVAGIAHEINNPVNFIYGNLVHTDEYIQDLLKLVQLYQDCCPEPTPEILELMEDSDLEFMSEDLPKMLSSMKVGADRIRDIVLSLRNFSRLDEAEMKDVNIHEGIDSTLLILQNRFKEKAGSKPIKVVKQYGNLPLVECYAGQLNQVFMNILANAIDALESHLNQKDATSQIDPPEISIRTEVIKSNWVAIRIRDNGPGMTEEICKRLFDPFFTTKPIGKGTGLGLSISYQIVVEKHQGVLECVSEPGIGTEFSIEIPVQQQVASSTSTLASLVNESPLLESSLVPRVSESVGS